MEKLVSVCISAYNSASTVLETLNSVVNQTYKNLQIIVVDDCSTDDTVQLIKSIDDTRIELHKTVQNFNVTVAFNESLKYVKGDYIARIDADDVWQPDKIEKQVKFLENHLEYGACFTYAQIIDKFGNINCDSELNKAFIVENDTQIKMYRFLYDNLNHFCHSSSLIRSQVMKEIGNYDVSILQLQDYDYWMRLLPKYNVYIIPEYLTIYRTGGISSEMIGKKLNIHNNEYLRAIYKSVNICPDKIFLETFADKLKFQGKHTHEETEIEKAFVLLEGTFYSRGNPVLGILKFSELFQNEKYVKIASDKFNFFAKDLYKYEEMPFCLSSLALTNNFTTVYFDRGNGFNENDTVKYDLAEDGVFNLKLDVSKDVKSIRVDPVDSALCMLTELNITSDGKSIAYGGNFIATDNGKTALFFSTDPQIVFDVNSTSKTVDIAFKVFEFGLKNTEMQKKFEDVISLVDNNFFVQSDGSSHKDFIIKNYEEILKEKNDIIKNRDQQIVEIKKQNDKQIKNLNSVIANKENDISNILKQNSYLLSAYNEIQSSFFWRITSPMRKISTKTKAVLSKSIGFMTFLVFVKGFLRGGIKRAKLQVYNYRKFIEEREKKMLSKIDDNTRKEQTKYKFSKNVKFSILVPLYNTPKDFLEEMIKSVQDQTYTNWELCLADGSTANYKYVEKLCKKFARKDKRIIYKKLEKNLGISENTNECIKMATGDFIALFDHDDVLHPSALFECMKQICDNNADYVYTDEATFLGSNINNIITIHYKPDFAKYNLLANNYICHFSVFSAKLIEKAGMFRHDYDGSQDHDMILRLTDSAENVVHIPKILYFWRSHENSVAMDINSKAYAIKAGRNAVHDFLKTKGKNTTVTSSPAFPTIYRIRYEIIGEPLVSIIIPTKDHLDDLKRCISSIKSKSTYQNYEIVIVDNGSTDKSLSEYYSELSVDPKIKILHYDYPFNYSAINNYGVSNCNGDYVLLLNNDTEVISPDWIEELLMYAQNEDVGAVGAKLFFADDTVQHGGIILGLGADRIAGHSHYGVTSDNLGYMGRMFFAQNVSAVTAACLMVKKSKYDQINGFDEKQAVAYNDVDFCLRLDELGYSNIFNPFCELYHYESISRGLDTNEKNRRRFLNEATRFKEKWEDKLEKGDPYYNPNFSLEKSYYIE